MLTKKTIRDLIKSNNLTQLYTHLNNSVNDKDLLFILANLGRLPNDFDGQVLLSYLNHSNNQIRLWAVKNLGKLSNKTYLPYLTRVLATDTESTVRREAVSALGRMRTEETIPTLIATLDDVDPKIILQAIRGLLVFKQNKAVQTHLKKLINHPYEIIQAVIQKEFFSTYQNAPKSAYSPVEPPPFMKNVVVHGNVQDILQSVPTGAIHLTFTSPPYFNARDYSIYPSYQAYLDFLATVFQQIHRITKEGRFLIINTSPVIMPRISRKYASKRYAIPFDLHPLLTKMGWEFIDDIIWIKPETSVKNRNAGFLQHRKPLGYKANPVTEYVMVYRKQSDRLIDWNMRQYPKEVIEASKIKGEYESSNAWYIDPVFDKVHSAVFPLELCHRIIKFYSYQGDLIFDPFGGSGTTGKAAINLDRYFFLTEQNKTYIERMKETLNHLPLFANQPLQFLSSDEFEKIAEKAIV